MTGSAYDPRRESGGVEKELARLEAQALLSWPHEARMLDWLGLRDGMHVLELGSGPGYVTRQLLSLLPASQITAVEIDPLMLDQARAYLTPAELGRVNLVQTSVMAPALAEGSFDFAVARFLFQHLPNPVDAARAILPLLKPGGALVIIDIDAALWGISQPLDPRLGPVYAKAARRQASEGGNRAIGRSLWRILAQAGYQDPRLEAYVYHSDELGIEPFAPQMDPARLLPAREERYITAQEYELARSAYERFLASPDSYVLMIGLMAKGTRPAS